MTVPLHPEMLAHAYDYLRSIVPFSGWNLPDSEDVVFRVIKNRRVYGQARLDGPKYVIEISEARVGRHEVLLSTMAHELVHINAHQSCFLNNRSHHDAAFNKLADQVCKIHDFDRKVF
jgi:predicted metallopeptidase